MPGAGGAGSGRPTAPGPHRRRAGVFQQLGAGKLDTEAPAGKKFVLRSFTARLVSSTFCHVGSPPHSIQIPLTYMLFNVGKHLNI